MKGESAMKLEVTVSEITDIFKEIQEQPGKLFEMIRLDIREVVGNYLTEMMNAELTHYLGREPYVRVEGKRANHRNGSYGRGFTLKGIGEVHVDIPRDRNGEFKTTVIPRSKQYEEEVARDFSILFLAGVSTRTLSMLSERLIGRKISPAEISSASSDLNEAVETWRRRDLSEEPVKYLFIDGVHFHMRMGRTIESIPVLVAIGVTETGQKLVLSLQAGDKESATSWREFFKDLKSRGMKGGNVTLGIMDGLPGLETVFREEFPQAKTQRCQVHVARNVLAKVSKKFKKDVANDLRSIFYAPSRETAWACFEAFIKRWEKTLPSAVECLKRSIDACLTFFNFPSEEWISLRTTNIIERLNKEFRRRTKVMEIVAGETACYRILAYISLKMELHWRSNPVGKVRKNLPFFKELAYENFTQKN
ncbi:transposase [Syntrophus aciditrophicus SB]|uniref:Mutator family transposase n=2 Tax=Syntrophus TaxID=43773 RepID=Q2LS39_SYNAS|nr:transposase [Syntrophus aciditrophicus SB]